MSIKATIRRLSSLLLQRILTEQQSKYKNEQADYRHTPPPPKCFWNAQLRLFQASRPVDTGARTQQRPLRLRSGQQSGGWMLQEEIAGGTSELFQRQWLLGQRAQVVMQERKVRFARQHVSSAMQDESGGQVDRRQRMIDAKEEVVDAEDAIHIAEHVPKPGDDPGQRVDRL